MDARKISLTCGDNTTSVGMIGGGKAFSEDSIDSDSEGATLGASVAE